MNKMISGGHINKTMLLGSLKEVPEPFTTKNGGCVATIDLVTNCKLRDSETGEYKNRSEWHQVVLFGGLARKIAKIGRPGMRFYVEGAKHTRCYTSKGQEFKVVQVIAEVCQPMDAVQVSYIGEANE